MEQVYGLHAVRRDGQSALSSSSESSALKSSTLYDPRSDPSLALFLGEPYPSYPDRSTIHATDQCKSVPGHWMASRNTGGPLGGSLNNIGMSAYGGGMPTSYPSTRVGASNIYGNLSTLSCYEGVGSSAALTTTQKVPSLTFYARAPMSYSNGALGVQQNSTTYQQGFQTSLAWSRRAASASCAPTTAHYGLSNKVNSLQAPLPTNHSNNSALFYSNNRNQHVYGDPAGAPYNTPVSPYRSYIAMPFKEPTRLALSANRPPSHALVVQATPARSSHQGSKIKVAESNLNSVSCQREKQSTVRRAYFTESGTARPDYPSHEPAVASITNNSTHSETSEGHSSTLRATNTAPVSHERQPEQDSYVPPEPEVLEATLDALGLQGKPKLREHIGQYWRFPLTPEQIEEARIVLSKPRGAIIYNAVYDALEPDTQKVIRECAKRGWFNVVQGKFKCPICERCEWEKPRERNIHINVEHLGVRVRCYCVVGGGVRMQCKQTFAGHQSLLSHLETVKYQGENVRTIKKAAKEKRQALSE